MLVSKEAPLYFRYAHLKNLFKLYQYINSEN